MKKLALLSVILFSVSFFSFQLAAQPSSNKVNTSALPRLKVSDNKRFLVQANGKPFFYLGDTAWELFHRLSFQDAELYFENRKKLGFTVIQAVVLAELDGLNTPNANGHTPLIDNDPERPNEDYFKDVDNFINMAAQKGLYIGLLPTWGDKVNKSGWGKGPEIFNEENANKYGKYLGNRYKDFSNIIWIIGGDRNPRGEKDVAIWNAMAEGVATGIGGYDKALMTYHPQPKQDGGSSTWFHQNEWLDFNMLQTGHCRNGTNYDKITHDYNLLPVKPVMDGEPLYEDHPVCFDWKKNGYSNADDVRKLAYWQIFAGAHGHTYGCHDIWQFYDGGNDGVNFPKTSWKEAINFPGAQQMGYVKKLITSESMLDRIPDQALILSENPKDSAYCSATRAEDGKYAFIYTPTGRNLQINTEELKGKSLTVKWFNPRNGEFTKPTTLVKKPALTFSPPVSGEGKDWVLVLSSGT